MKKTIKSLIVGLALTTVANAQRSLNLRDIEVLFENAVQEEAGKIFNSIAKLQFSYADALRNYRNELVAKRDTDGVAIIAAIDVELRNMETIEGGSLKELVPGADFKMKTFRNTYARELNLIVEKGERQTKIFREVLFEQLKALKNNLTKAGDVEGALTVHGKLAKLGALSNNQEDLVDYNQSTEDISIGVTKELQVDNDYRYAHSKQRIKLIEGRQYVFTMKFIAAGEGIITPADELPNFLPMEGVSWNAGPEWTALKKTYGQRRVVIEDDKFGWSTLTFKFTSHITMDVRFGLSTHLNDTIYFKNFSLVDTINPDRNLISKDLTNKRMWINADELKFSKGVNKAGK